MIDQLNQFEKDALARLAGLNDSASLGVWKSETFGKQSLLSTALTALGTLPKDERPPVGRRTNEVKQALEMAYAEKEAAIRAAELERSLRAEAFDVTLPGRPVRRGRIHIANQNLRQICAIWADMGFQIYRSREVETDDYNFELLNMPQHHPARDMWDTFFTTTPGVILRTHTSPGQIHAMREYCPNPIRVVLPGMVYRYEQITARSEIQFNQVEGLAVGKGIRFTDLKAPLSDFARRMFGANVHTRFRADHFPFTEPSAEMDVECFVCGGRGCAVCQHSGGVEVLGCGMVDPTVPEDGGKRPKVYSGFAFGMGPERIAMLKYKIEDIRYFWGNDLRFLEQF